MHIFTISISNESIDILNNFLNIVKNYFTFTDFKINNGNVSDEYYEINVLHNINNKEIRYLIKLSKNNNYRYIPVINKDNVIAFTINLIKILSNNGRKR